jgi:Na+/glutamate symporter
MKITIVLFAGIQYNVGILLSPLLFIHRQFGMIALSLSLDTATSHAVEP